MKNEVYIRPYVDQGAVKDGTDLGVGQYGHVLFEGAAQREALAYVEDFPGVKRWKNGLNEEAPEVVTLPEDKKAAKVTDIRKAAAFIEKRLTGKKVDVTDEKFWEKITLVRNDNHEFWSKVTLTTTNEPQKLNPEDAQDYIKMLAIEAGGFDNVAPSLEHIKNSNRSYMWYLDKVEDTASTNTSVYKLRDEAGAELQKIYKKDLIKLRYVIKLIAPDSTRYNNNTSPDVIYEDCSRHMEGQLGEKSKKKAIEKFLSVVKMPMDELRIKAVMADARKFSYIDAKADGQIYLMETGAALGRTMEDVYLYLKSPINQDVWDSLSARVEKYWNGGGI